MDRRAKRFWIPWAGVMSLAVVFMLMGAGRNDAGAQGNASWPDAGAVVLASVPASMPASQPVSAENVQGIASVLSSAVHGSNWRLAVIAGLLLAVFILRKAGGFFWPALRTDRGGAILALLAAVLVVLVNGIVAGRGFDPQLILDGVLTGLTAIGSFTAAKKIAAPSDSHAKP